MILASELASAGGVISHNQGGGPSEGKTLKRLVFRLDETTAECPTWQAPNRILLQSGEVWRSH